MMVLFKDAAAAIEAVPLIMNAVRIIPTSIEFMDKLTLDTTCEFLKEKKLREDAGAVLIIELDGNDSDHVRQDCLDIGDMCLDNGALDAFVAEGPSDQDKIWKVRKHAAEAFKAISPIQTLEDIVVPTFDIPKLIPILENLSEKHDVIIPCYGHAGDGNMHATIVKKPEESIENWEDKLPLVLNDLYLAVTELGGTISGEHGIGYKRKDYLSLALGSAEIESMKRIKRALDPNNILNPGKIFDLE
jgi:glycolate oxidase